MQQTSLGQALDWDIQELSRALQHDPGVHLDRVGGIQNRSQRVIDGDAPRALEGGMRGPHRRGGVIGKLLVLLGGFTPAT